MLIFWGRPRKPIVPNAIVAKCQAVCALANQILKTHAWRGSSAHICPDPLVKTTKILPKKKVFPAKIGVFFRDFREKSVFVVFLVGRGLVACGRAMFIFYDLRTSLRAHQDMFGGIMF